VKDDVMNADDRSFVILETAKDDKEDLPRITSIKGSPKHTRMLALAHNLKAPLQLSEIQESSQD